MTAADQVGLFIYTSFNPTELSRKWENSSLPRLYYHEIMTNVPLKQSTSAATVKHEIDCTAMYDVNGGQPNDVAEEDRTSSPTIMRFPSADITRVHCTKRLMFLKPQIPRLPAEWVNRTGVMCPALISKDVLFSGHQREIWHFP